MYAGCNPGMDYCTIQGGIGVIKILLLYDTENDINTDQMDLVRIQTIPLLYILYDFDAERHHRSANYILFVYRFGEHLLTNGWSGLFIPTDSFYKDGQHYLWIQFTTNGGNADGRFNRGWTGTYQRYWPYVTSKKKKRSLVETPVA